MPSILQTSLAVLTVGGVLITCFRYFISADLATLKADHQHLTELENERYGEIKKQLEVQSNAIEANRLTIEHQLEKLLDRAYPAPPASGEQSHPTALQLHTANGVVKLAADSNVALQNALTHRIGLTLANTFQPNQQPLFWKTASTILTYRSGGYSAQTQHLSCRDPRSHAVFVSPPVDLHPPSGKLSFIPFGIIYFKDCVADLSDHELVEELKAAHHLQQGGVIYERCRIEYSGDTFAFDDVDFRSCTFSFNLEKDPPESSKNLVRTLLAANDYKEITVKTNT